MAPPLQYALTRVEDVLLADECGPLVARVGLFCGAGGLDAAPYLRVLLLCLKSCLRRLNSIPTVHITPAGADAGPVVATVPVARVKRSLECVRTSFLIEKKRSPPQQKMRRCMPSQY